jgi:Tfp pilus assembly protein PilF
VYPAVFVAGLCLYGLCGVAGISYTVVTEHHLPSFSGSAFSQAEHYLSGGDLRRATQQFRMAARIDRADYDTPQRLAFILSAVGDASGQVDQYERARDLSPGDPVAHRLLGWAYYNNRRFDDADAAFIFAARLNPRDIDAQIGRANAWLERDRPVEAEHALEVALRLDVRNATVHNLMGIALGMQGRRAEAIRAFEEAVRLDPSPLFKQNLEGARRLPVPRETTAP